jgi:hypothetical protein
MEVPTPPRKDLTLKETKRREAWETELRIALYQRKCLIDNLRIFDNNLSNVLQRYEVWLKHRNIEPLVNLDVYRN